MHSTWVLLLTGIAGVAIGAMLGYWLSRLRKGSTADGTSASDLQILRAQHEAYRHQVADHFTHTAELLDQLIGNYREIHNHLATGAEILCGDKATVQLKPLADEHQGRLPQQAAEPPRDYAPRPGSGVLDEGFGIEKLNRTPTPEPPRY